MPRPGVPPRLGGVGLAALLRVVHLLLPAVAARERHHIGVALGVPAMMCGAGKAGFMLLLPTLLRLLLLLLPAPLPRIARWRWG